MTHTPPPPRRARTFLAWVWAGLLISGGLGFLGLNTGLIPYEGPLAPVLAAGTALLAVPFAIRWLVHRDEWWAALAAWVFLAVGILLGVLALNLPTAQIVGAVALAEAALPFAALYLSNRRRRWALIPCYALLVLAGLLALTILPIPLQTVGAIGLLAAALPLWAVYMLNRARWWALISAGALSAAGVLLVGASTFLRPGTASFYVLINLALAAVSLAIYLTVRRFDWALWLAVGFGLAAGLSIGFPSTANWALAALALGLYIVYRQVGVGQSRTARKPPQPTPPPAAKPGLPPPMPPSAPPGGTPVVEFRPLDPFKARRELPSEEEESEEEQSP